ncbi:MAG: nitroreductase family protein [Candidatus Omnitrophica bacterium]|nr:nitroreductase family protein [Candidatus Omnitrophota bacterium]MCF7894014.1 nitroreductase family protein [Candidatus Omnitrophota bacterium]
MGKTDILKLMKNRRSIRKFQDKEISVQAIKESLEAARWAPSGLNNQPWKFMILEQDKKDSLAKYTKFGQVIKQANKLIIVFLNKEKLYSYKKDLMAIGAAIQNILIYLQSQNVGSCWLGEIINQAEQVQNKLQVPPELEFVAAIAAGVPQEEVKITERRSLEDLIL